MNDLFKRWIKENRLLRFYTMEGHMIWGRLLEYREKESQLLVYEDDRKSMIILSLHEIKEIQQDDLVAKIQK